MPSKTQLKQQTANILHIPLTCFSLTGTVFGYSSLTEWGGGGLLWPHFVRHERPPGPVPVTFLQHCGGTLCQLTSLLYIQLPVPVTCDASEIRPKSPVPCAAPEYGYGRLGRGGRGPSARTLAYPCVRLSCPSAALTSLRKKKHIRHINQDPADRHASAELRVSRRPISWAFREKCSSSADAARVAFWAQSSRFY